MSAAKNYLLTVSLFADRWEQDVENLVWNTFAGDHNKDLRQDFMTELTGTKLPKAKCGIHAITDKVIEIRKTRGGHNGI